MRSTVVSAVVGGVAFVGACGVAAASVNGSGASFPNAAYSKWCSDSKLCSYTSKGSGGGITDFTNGVVDFAASDAVLKDDQLAALKSSRGGAGVVYFPTLLGAITVPVNLKDIKHLRLDGPTVAGIFKGSITKWNDPKIATDNKDVKPAVKLPNSSIAICVRADSSGTSSSFTRYLGNVDADFATKIPASSTPNWPSGGSILKQPGNAGVANCVKTTDNAIGYVDLADAQNSGLGDKIAAIGAGTVAPVKKNPKKKKAPAAAKKTFVLPTSASIAAAAKAPAAANDPNLTPDFTKFASRIPNAYPITITTWVLAYDDFGKAKKSGSLKGVKDVLNYFYGDTAQKQLAGIGYTALPAALLTRAKAKVGTLK